MISVLLIRGYTVDLQCFVLSSVSRTVSRSGIIFAFECQISNWNFDGVILDVRQTWAIKMF